MLCRRSQTFRILVWYAIFTHQSLLLPMTHAIRSGAVRNSLICTSWFMFNVRQHISGSSLIDAWPRTFTRFGVENFRKKSKCHKKICFFFTNSNFFLWQSWACLGKLIVGAPVTPSHYCDHAEYYRVNDKSVFTIACVIHALMWLLY